MIMRPGTAILLIFVVLAAGSGGIMFAWPTSLHVAAKGYMFMVVPFSALVIAGLSTIGIGISGYLVLQRLKRELREEIRAEYEGGESAEASVAQSRSPEEDLVGATR